MNLAWVARSFWLSPNLSLNDKAIYTVLRAFQSPETGVCAPTSAELMRATGLARNTLKERLAHARKMGVISWTTTANRRVFHFNV